MNEDEQYVVKYVIGSKEREYIVCCERAAPVVII